MYIKNFVKANSNKMKYTPRKKIESLKKNLFPDFNVRSNLF